MACSPRRRRCTARDTARDTDLDPSNGSRLCSVRFDGAAPAALDPSNLTEPAPRAAALDGALYPSHERRGGRGARAGHAVSFETETRRSGSSAAGLQRRPVLHTHSSFTEAEAPWRPRVSGCRRLSDRGVQRPGGGAGGGAWGGECDVVLRLIRGPWALGPATTPLRRRLCDAAAARRRRYLQRRDKSTTRDQLSSPYHGLQCSRAAAAPCPRATRQRRAHINKAGPARTRASRRAVRCGRTPR